MIEILPEASSTNTAMAQALAVCPNMPHGHAIMAGTQTAGRGQRGNSWEAEPGQNITLSLLLRPESLEARHQFAISEAVALGVVHTLRQYSIDSHVKWPNDIYAATDMKICGILIENTLTGMHIDHSIAGIGLNVNQTAFTSNAPNPISMAMITGNRYSTTEVAAAMVKNILKLMKSDRNALHSEYMQQLWRGNGYHNYRDTASGKIFSARITDVALTGHMTLMLQNGEERTYAFKEVSAIL